MLTAAGSAWTLNVFFFVRRPPSNSYKTLRVRVTSAERPFVRWTNGDFEVLLNLLRAKIRPQPVVLVYQLG